MFDADFEGLTTPNTKGQRKPAASHRLTERIEMEGVEVGERGFVLDRGCLWPLPVLGKERADERGRRDSPIVETLSAQPVCVSIEDSALARTKLMSSTIELSSDGWVNW